MDSRLQEEGMSFPYELANQSSLDEACEVVLELNALQRQQSVMAREAGVASKQAKPLKDRHMDVAVIRNLFFDDKLQSVVAENFGTSLFLWRTNFFAKGEGYPQISWHHDRHFENGDAPINIYDLSNHFSITVALTDIDRNAGGLEYVKGSHVPIAGFDRDLPRHVLEVPEVIENRVTSLPLKRGQFVVFYSSLLHRSLAFGEGEGRISMAGRLAKVGTRFPTFGATNPAGGEQTRAQPIARYEDSGQLPFN